MATDSTANWTGRQAVMFATALLLVGFAIGYLFAGSRSPVSARQLQLTSDNASVPASQQITPDDLRRMADKQAQPFLSKLQQNSQDPQLLAAVGDTYLKAQQLPLAIEYYKRALQVDPNNSGVVINLGDAYYYSGDTRNALAQFDRALQINPNSANALFNIGMIKWRDEGDPKAAIAAWKELLKRNPDHPDRQRLELLIERATQHVNMPSGPDGNKAASNDVSPMH